MASPEGWHHQILRASQQRGIADARNVARILLALWQQGVVPRMVNIEFNRSLAMGFLHFSGKFLEAAQSDFF